MASRAQLVDSIGSSVTNMCSEGNRWDPWKYIESFPFAPPNLDTPTLFELYWYYFNSPFHYFPKILDIHKASDTPLLHNFSDHVRLIVKSLFRVPEVYVQRAEGNVGSMCFIGEGDLKVGASPTKGRFFMSFIPEDYEEEPEGPDCIHDNALSEDFQKLRKSETTFYDYNEYFKFIAITLSNPKSPVRFRILPIKPNLLPSQPQPVESQESEQPAMLSLSTPISNPAVSNNEVDMKISTDLYSVPTPAPIPKPEKRRVVKVRFCNSSKEKRYHIDGPHHALCKPIRNKLDHILDIPTHAWTKEDASDLVDFCHRMVVKAADVWKL